MCAIGQVAQGGHDLRGERGAGQVGVAQPLVGPEQVGHLREAALAHELADGVPAIQQAAIGAVHERECGLPREDAGKTR